MTDRPITISQHPHPSLDAEVLKAMETLSHPHPLVHRCGPECNTNCLGPNSLSRSQNTVVYGCVERDASTFSSHPAWVHSSPPTFFRAARQDSPQPIGLHPVTQEPMLSPLAYVLRIYIDESPEGSHTTRYVQEWERKVKEEKRVSSPQGSSSTTAAVYTRGTGRVRDLKKQSAITKNANASEAIERTLEEYPKFKADFATIGSLAPGASKTIGTRLRQGLAFLHMFLLTSIGKCIRFTFYTAP